MFEILSILAAMNAAKPTRVVSVDWMAENHPEILEDALKRAAEKREHAKNEVAEAKKQLMKALEERTDLKYAADVAPDNYDQLRSRFGLRVFATPKKMGAQTSEANVNAGLAAARQIVDYFATGNKRFQVNR